MRPGRPANGTMTPPASLVCRHCDDEIARDLHTMTCPQETWGSPQGSNELAINQTMYTMHFYLFLFLLRAFLTVVFCVVWIWHLDSWLLASLIVPLCTEYLKWTLATSPRSSSAQNVASNWVFLPLTRSLLAQSVTLDQCRPSCMLTPCCPSHSGWMSVLSLPACVLKARCH